MVWAFFLLRLNMFRNISILRLYFRSSVLGKQADKCKTGVDWAAGGGQSGWIRRFVSLVVKQRLASLLCGFMVCSAVWKIPKYDRSLIWFGLPSESIRYITSRFRLDLKHIGAVVGVQGLCDLGNYIFIKWYAWIRWDLMNMLVLLWVLSCYLWAVQIKSMVVHVYTLWEIIGVFACMETPITDNVLLSVFFFCVVFFFLWPEPSSRFQLCVRPVLTMNYNERIEGMSQNELRPFIFFIYKA